MSVDLQLTEAEKRRLRNPRWAAKTVELPIDINGDEPITLPWRSGDDPNGHDPRTHPRNASRRKITLERCNAIRCAAADGVGYAEMVDLFTFVGARTTAHDHATGSCVHGDDDMPPVSTNPCPAGNGGRISWAECREMRSQYRDGATCAEAGDVVGYSESAAYRHIVGECDHRGGVDR